jgi:ketosteroid isomerase-like protein
MNETFWRAGAMAVMLMSGMVALTMAAAPRNSDRAALDAALQRWLNAVNAQDVKTLGATMTDDVQLLGTNGAGVTGRDAIIRTLRDAAARGRLVATSREISIADDMAWHVVELTQVQENGDVHSRGQALEIWKRVNGEWKLHRRMAAGIVGAENSLTRPSTKEPVLDRPRN